MPINRGVKITFRCTHGEADRWSELRLTLGYKKMSELVRHAMQELDGQHPNLRPIIVSDKKDAREVMPLFDGKKKVKGKKVPAAKKKARKKVGVN